MATEEVNKPPSLPPYPEMILSAIEALHDDEGSNKSSISSYIESKYGELPASHSTLLTNHLNKMKESGELIMVKNNYMKPDPNAPPKRGRGRPPKPKSEKAEVVEKGPARPRGRPRKDPSAPPKEKKASSGGKGRGRPKKPRTDDEASGEVTESAKKRGRPRKLTAPSTEEVSLETNE